MPSHTVLKDSKIGQLATRLSQITEYAIDNQLALSREFSCFRLENLDHGQLESVMLGDTIVRLSWSGVNKDKVCDIIIIEQLITLAAFLEWVYK